MTAPAPTPMPCGRGRRRPCRPRIAGISSAISARPCRAGLIVTAVRFAKPHAPCRRRPPRRRGRCRRPATREERLRADAAGPSPAPLRGDGPAASAGSARHAIGRAVGASPPTVYRWLKAGGPPTHNKPERPRNVAPHEAFLARRWAEGCRNGARLWRELRAQGYRGGQRSVVRWTTRRRREEGGGSRGRGPHARRLGRAPSSRRCARLLGMPPDRLEAQGAGVPRPSCPGRARSGPRR